MNRTHLLRPAGIAAAAAVALALAACDDKRTAEADTPVSEAEVSTELPETVVSDERLEAAANAAADVAAMPPADVVAVPVNAPPATPGAGTTTANTSGNTTGRSQ